MYVCIQVILVTERMGSESFIQLDHTRAGTQD